MKRKADQELRHAEENLNTAHKHLLNENIPEAITHICLVLTMFEQARKRDKQEIERIEKEENKGG